MPVDSSGPPALAWARDPAATDKTLLHTGPMELVVDLRRHRAHLRSLSHAVAEFPRVDPRHIGLNAVARIDIDSGRMQRFEHGEEWLVEEHVLVPGDEAPEGDGWLVGTAWDRMKRKTLFSVFDAAAVDAGPIARAHLPYGLPLGLQGAFVGA